MNIEEKIEEIYNRVCSIDEKLNDRYRFKVDEKSINEYLSEITSDDLHMIGCDEVYKAYVNTTTSPASKRKLNNAIKNTFSLKMKHTTKNGKNLYYWYMEENNEGTNNKTR